MNYGLISRGNIQLKEKGRNARQEKNAWSLTNSQKKIASSPYNSFFFFYSSFSYGVLILVQKLCCLFLIPWVWERRKGYQKITK
jgi:hypothetical protein